MTNKANDCTASANAALADTGSVNTGSVITGSVLVHPQELDKKWIDRCVSLGIPRIGLHPVGGGEAAKSLDDLLCRLKTPEFTSLLDLAAERGLEIEYEFHAARWCLPASEFEAHPEWMRMNDAGERVADLNFCVTNEDALDFYARRAVECAKQLYRSGKRFYLWMDDAKGGACHCPKCREYSVSDQQLIVANRVIGELRREIPDACLAYLAYVDCMTPPNVKPADGIFLEFAPIERDFHKPIGDPDSQKNRHEVEHLPALLEYFGHDNAKVLDYWLDNSLYSGWKKPPKEFHEDRDVIAADFKYYRALGIHDLSTFACYLGEDYIELYGEPDISGFAAELKK